MKPNNLDGIYQSYMNDIYRYLRSLCDDHHAAEDLVQETFYRAYLYLEDCKADKTSRGCFESPTMSMWIIDSRRSHGLYTRII